MPKFIMPLDNPKVTSAYGWRVIFGNKEWHQGIDLIDTKLGAKAPIYAMADGTVSYAGTLSSYGLVVRIKHKIDGVNYETLYAHLSKINVKVGQTVKQTDVIGVIGTTGRSTGIHLHAEIHVNGFWSTGQPLAKDLLNYASLSDTPSKFKSNGSELTMSQYNELKKIIETQNAKIKELENKLSNKMDILSEREVGKSHKEAWSWAEKEGLLNGKSPQDYISREQLGTVMKRLSDKLSK